MKLIRYAGRGYAFEGNICVVGHNFKLGYFIVFRFPFIDSGRNVYASKTKPRFRNMTIISMLFALPYATLYILGLVWMALVGTFILIGAAKLVEEIKEVKQLGGLTNIASVFSLTVFYLIGIISLASWLLK